MRRTPNNAARLQAMNARQDALVPPVNDGPATYRASRLTDADKGYLLRMDVPYRLALGHVPGAHQIFFDVLTDDADRTWFDLGTDGTPSGRAWKITVNTIINDADRLPGVYQSDPAQYTGPLKAVVGAAIMAKLHAR